MKKNLKKLIGLIAITVSSTFWRMGGAEGYSKLWRRIGSTIAMSIIVWDWRAIPFIAWGCTSYFDWINNFIPSIKDKNREYWWNYFAGNLVIQLSFLFVAQDVANIILAVSGALLVAIVKVWINNKYPLQWKPRQDLVSEIWHGGGNALVLFINTLI